MPERIPFWNIDLPFLMYLFSMVALFFFFYGTLSRVLRLRRGVPEDGRGGRVGNGFKRLIRMGLLQERVLEKPLIGISHLLIFWGFWGLFLGAGIEFLGALLPFGIAIRGNSYLVISGLLDFCGLLALIGATILFLNRISNFSNFNFRENFLILVIALMMITGFILEGFRIAALQPRYEYWSFVGWSLSSFFVGIETGKMKFAYVLMWWLHAGLSFLFIAYIPYSKLFHLVTTPFHLLNSAPEAAGILAPIPNINERQRWGVGNMEEFTRKELLEIENCMGCGRCEEKCPAVLSQKSLNPKALFSQFQEFMIKQQDRTFAISPEIIWGCTTCLACAKACPVLNNPGGKIIHIRRHLILNQSSFPQEYLGIFRSLKVFGDPYGKGKYFRTEWAQGLKMKVLEKENSSEWTYWVGCQGAFHDRNKRVAVSLIRILNLLGIDFGILGKNEACCGEPARRMGNEYLFQTMAKENIERFKRLGIRKIVTSCPHCFHILKNEYPALGGELEVLHVNDFLLRFLAERKDQVLPLKRKVTFHDSCYLGRYNGLYEPPRRILELVPELELREMRRRKENALCCGGGGGGVYFEEKRGERMAQIRLTEALETSPQIILTSCPFCLTLMEDAVRFKQNEGTVETLDLVELLERVLFR